MDSDTGAISIAMNGIVGRRRSVNSIAAAYVRNIEQGI